LPFVLLTVPALAIEAQEQLGSKAQEARAVKIGDSLRCVVCPSGTVNDSPAELAGDLRRLIRTEVHAGKTDAEIREYIRMRYGDYVLLDPPLKPGTLALWFGPFLLLVAGLWAYLGVLFPKSILAQRLKSWVFRVKTAKKNT
jgi:cytochrome c-type biogenesis protein CcmH